MTGARILEPLSFALHDLGLWNSDAAPAAAQKWCFSIDPTPFPDRFDPSLHAIYRNCSTNLTTQLTLWLAEAVLTRKGGAQVLVDKLVATGAPPRAYTEILALEVIIAAHRPLHPTLLGTFPESLQYDIGRDNELWKNRMHEAEWLAAISNPGVNPSPTGGRDPSIDRAFWDGRPPLEEWVAAIAVHGLDLSPALLNPAAAATREGALALAERLATSENFDGREWAGRYLSDVADELTRKTAQHTPELGASPERSAKLSHMVRLLNWTRFSMKSSRETPEHIPGWEVLVECAATITGGKARCTYGGPDNYTNKVLAAMEMRMRLSENAPAEPACAGMAI